MTESKFSTTLKAAREHLAVATNQVREGLAGRSKQVVGIAALAGIAGLGISAASIAHPTTITPVAVASTAGVSVDRQSAADRANRHARAEVTASASAKATTGAPSKNKIINVKPKAAAPAAKPKAAAAPKPKYAYPMAGAMVTSCFGQRWGVLHAGIDFATAENTPIHAVVGGTVVNAGWAFRGYGNSVVVDHGNGTLTHYAHMNRTAVKVGQKVSAGTILGYEGSTGDSTGPHLHFEVHNGMWNQINPAGWLAARGIKTGC